MVLLIFPTQLFSNLNHLTEIVYLIEEPRYFTDFKFHKLKLAYHRATMKKYYDKLVNKKYNIKYVDFSKVSNLFYSSLNNKYDEITIINPGDLKLEDKLKKIFGKKLVILDNINWLVKINELNNIKKLIFKNNKYSHEEFYKYQRKKLDLLVDENNKPVGGKWSYDSSNRKPLPKNHKIPNTVNKIINNSYTKEAIDYVNKHFPNNYGSLDNFIYPIDTLNSLKWLNKFIKQRLQFFGPYEDAVDESEPFIYHSVLSPMMNIGLITDTQVINTVTKYYLKHKKTISIESYEGFIRQVIGWRNYVYVIYMLDGHKLFEMNHLKHTNKINDKFWTGSTNIKPIDSLINKIIKYAYAHHIERLMYLGNFMLLCQINPKDVYKIFMEWTIDSYEWVMIPNVFGMSQYADGGIIMTRPYFSSSNYINKMSSFKRNDEWSIVWDALYYNFIHSNKSILEKNYATSQLVKHWNNKSTSEKKQIIDTAQIYLIELFKNKKIEKLTY